MTDIQTKYRLRLVNFWNIDGNSRVLEVGCGHGDATNAIGSTLKGGTILGIDSAPETSGSPHTYQQTWDRIKGMPWGNKTNAVFNTTLNSIEDEFDDVVFCHSLFYFQSKQELFQTLVKARKIGKRLLFAEWDIEPKAIDQVGHYIAVLLQSLFGQHNIQTIFTRDEFFSLASDAGWKITEWQSVDCQELEDAEWEVNNALYDLSDNVDSIPERFLRHGNLRSHLNILRSLKEDKRLKSLNAFCGVGR
ncbi:MAG: trans-aconitate 2-methyltransferase [Oligoflexales bacterium]